MKDTMIAESVIRTLTEKKMGKASLALRQLEQVFEHRENREMRLPAGAIDWLIHKVKPAPELKRLIERLVNHTVLVPDIETAMRLFPQNGSMIVTLDGQVLTRDGILYGGATTEAQNSVLQRKNQIALLEGEANEIRSAFQEVNARRDALLLEIEETQRLLEDSREEKQNSALSVSTLRGQLTALERELRETERKQQNLEGERASSEARLYEASMRLEGLETEVNGFLEQFETLQARRAEAQTDLEMLRAQENEVGSELNELRIKVATERQRHTSLHHQRQPMEARLTELGDLIAQRQRDIGSYAERAASMLAEISEIEANLGRLRVEAVEKEAHGSALVAERTGIALGVDEMNTTLRHLRQQLNDAHNQRSRVEVKQSQLEMKLTALREHIQKRYQIELEDFQNDYDVLRAAIRDQIKRLQRAAGEETGDSQNPHENEDLRGIDSFELDWERIDMIVREIDQRIDSMGPVNLDAIQEYDELEERNAFLEKQNNDLITSRAELLDVISKINQTTKTLFADTFEKIRLNFSEMFVELFGGGKANLLLTDESDPLESGIDIIAKPPGKQLQSISLLSGGERTMTAVALLFSIYMVKPAPFCVLDEMDAPLDESNISRFIKILDRFVGQSQFIVISHHKRTIARADALYGVTMEEHGVSRLVGVKFSKRDDSTAQEDVLGTSERVPSVAETFGKSGDLHSENAG
jgi:chromosome segregation protein